MKKLNRTAIVSFIYFLLVVSSAATQVGALQEMTMVIPAQSLSKAIKPLLPYQIDLGKNFLGSFLVKSIDNIRIKNDKVLFSSLISGKDIQYATKIGKQVVKFKVGDVDLPSRWEVSFKYDKAKRKLLITPLLQELKDTKNFSQGDALLNGLLTAFSGVEYPIDLKDLKPIKSEIYNQLLTVNMDISDIYAADNKLLVEITPTARIDTIKD